MKKSDGLFDLIHSLTPSEKRHFKLSSNLLKNENKKYLILFKALDKQRAYDEKKLRDTLKGQSFLKELHVIKAYLFESILKSLRMRRVVDLAVMDVYQLLHDNQILSRRGFHELGVKKLEKAEKLAENLNLSIPLIQIYSDELSHATRKAYSESNIAYIRSRFAEIQKELKTLKTDYILAELSYLLSTKQLFLGSNQKDGFRQEMDLLLKQAKKEFDPENSDLNTKKVFYKLVKDYYFQQGNKQEAYKYAKLCFDLVSADPEEPATSPHYYLVTLHDYFNELLGLAFAPQPEFRKYETVKKFIEKIERVPDVNSNTRYEKWLVSYRVFFMWCLFMGEYERGVDSARQVQKEWHTYAPNLRKVEAGYFYFYIARIYFGSGEYDASLEWINKILNDQEMDDSLVGYARLFSLAVHYELRNLRYLQHAVRSTHRFFRERKMLHRAERLILQFMKKIIKLGGKGDRDKEMRAIYDELRSLRENPAGSAPFRYFEFDLWCEAKLTNVPFRDVVHAKLQSASTKKS
jgi:hypothetical protein